MKKDSFLAKCFTQSVKVVEQGMNGEMLMDGTAECIMACVKRKVSPELYCKLMEMLLGIRPDLQKKMAKNLLAFVQKRVAHTTGCVSVDVVLEICYVWIGAEQGRVKKRLTNKLAASKMIDKNAEQQPAEVMINIEPTIFDSMGLTKGRIKRKDYLMFVLEKRLEEEEAMERGELKEKDCKTVKELREMFGEEIYDS